MKNRMQHVRDHLVSMMERLGDKDVTADDIARAKALSELAQTYTNTVKCEIDARKLAGMDQTLPTALEHRP
ncbi:MAG: hypothetical protein ACK51F_10500 [Rhodospirillales bacterium]